MADSRETGGLALVVELVRHAVHGSFISLGDVKPLLQKLLPPRDAGADGHTLYDLVCLLEGQGETEACGLAQRLHAIILDEACQAGRRRREDPAYVWRSNVALTHLPPDIPVGWRNDEAILTALQEAAQLERDRTFLAATAPEMAQPRLAVENAIGQYREHLRKLVERWTVLPPALFWKGFGGNAIARAPDVESACGTPDPGISLPPGATANPQAENDARLAELAHLAAAPGASDALDRLLSWPDAAAAPFIIQACTTASRQGLAMHALALRSGLNYRTWPEWEAWLGRAASFVEQTRTAATLLAEGYGAELRLLWLRDQPGVPDAALEAALAADAETSARGKVRPTEFVRRWEHALTPAEVARLGGGPLVAKPAAIPPPPLRVHAATPPPLPHATGEAGAGRLPQVAAGRQPREGDGPRRVVIRRPAPAPAPAGPAIPRRESDVKPAPTPPAPAAPSLWDEHIQPFLAANWYIIAGLLMVVAGASLLAYFTWDKSVLVRYLFLPVLLAAFTGGMAELGLRLYRRHEELRATGGFLLGGAVCLLPVNFMVLCRAGEDPQAAGVLLPALGLYAALAGAGLWRWCGQIRSELRLLLGMPLLAVNLLAVLGDMPGLREAAAGHRAALVPATITAAVLLLLAASNRFLQRVLTRELLEARIVPWFFGVTLAATTFQVASWRYFHLHITPNPRDFALAMILAGATCLRWERRAGELRHTGASYGGESFLGYAALLFGVLMAAGHEWLRIVALLLVGVIWLVQAPRRPGSVHYWIGVTICLLGGAAIGLLDAFPKSRGLNLLPELGLALALAAGALRALAGRFGELRLRKVAFEIQPPVLLLTAVVALLSQYNLRSQPWQTGAILLVVAGFFAVRATVAARRDWLHIAAACAGLALPYLGCADMVRYRFDGNTLALGLGLLSMAWLAAARLVPSATWRRTGDGILTAFGIAGIIGLLLRLTLAMRPDIAGADIAGGLLLAFTLAAAASHSQQRLPGMLASLLLAVVLPFFRIPAAAAPDWLYPGTGLTSAAVAFPLVLTAFVLRRLCSSHIFSAPVLAAAAWLAGKALALQIQHHADQMPFALSSLLVSAAIYAAAIYFRQHPAGPFLFHASWPLLAAGIAMACDRAGCRGWDLLQYPLLWTGVALTALLAVEGGVARRLEWARTFLVRPRLGVLAYGSEMAAALVAIIVRDFTCDHRASLQWLALFAGAQLLWHALRSAQRHWGVVLFVLAASWLCNFGSPPSAWASGFLGTNAYFINLLLFLLAILVADIVLEALPKPRAFLSPLRAPFVAGATVLSPDLALFAVGSVHHIAGKTLDISLPRSEAYMLVAILLLAARAQACAALALPAVALGWLLCRFPCSAEELFRPWPLAKFALLLALLPFLGRLLAARRPRLLCGIDPQLPKLVARAEEGRIAQAPWFIVPGLALAVLAAVMQMAMSAFSPSGDARWVQTLAPFAAVAAFALAAAYWRRGTLWAAAGCLLPVANVFAVSVLWGRDLLDLHLTPVHVVGSALVLTVAELAAVRRWVLRRRTEADLQAAYFLHGGCVALAGLTLVLLGANYLARPNLAEIPTIRFLASGLLAFGAGLYFRAAARRPESQATVEGLWLEGLWHASLGLALWCGALMIPALRTPHAALYALALPALACWGAAEWFRRDASDRLIAARFTISAAVFVVLVLVLYTFRLPFQLVLFPREPPVLDLYHTGAAAVVLMGWILFRVRGLGGAPWAALVGGVALMVGIYFGVTWLPGLSPFDFPMTGAWAAVAAAHLFILLSYQQSPVRSLLQHIGGISAEEWHAHRRQWGLFLTSAVHAAVLAGLLRDGASRSLEATPVLLALATVLIHQAVIGAPWGRAYYGAAVMEILVALHLDFLLPSGSPGLIPARQVVWYLLVPWLAAGTFWRRLPLRPVERIWPVAGGLALLCGAHLLYHGPETGSGLAVAVCMILAALLTPLPENTPAARTVAALMLIDPLWLAYFGTRWATGEGAAGFRPLLAAAAALLGTGMLSRQAPLLPAGSVHRLVHDVLAHCRRDTENTARILLGAAFAALTGITFLHPHAHTGSPGRMLALAFAWAIACVAWFREARLRDGVLPYSVSMLALAGAWLVLRRLMFRYFDFWTYEYDIWLSLGASIASGAAKRMVMHRQPGLGYTMTGAVWLIPVFQCFWLLYNRMSADLGLIVIGVQSMLFAWHGGGKRDSPYNGVSMLGFVGFVCLLFWARLDLRCVQAYTIPAGFGVLGLVWLFGEHLQAGLRHTIRLVAVLGMLGSCGYYALLDSRYPVGFHLTMILLCLAIMALGPLLRIQLYLYLGFAGFATDLTALVVKQFRALERSLQMMGIGALLLLLGIAVVGGAIVYKTRREAILTRLARLRGQLGSWE